MQILLVHIHVKPEYLDAFQAAMLDNARNSLLEPGVLRFDVLQQQEDPTRFTLVEVYRNQEAPALHKQTAHYNRWREAVADMLVEPRQGVWHTNVFPTGEVWK